MTSGKILTFVSNNNASSGSYSSEVYSNFNSSLKNNINYTQNIAKQNSLAFYIGNLTTKITSSFNLFLTLSNLLNNLSLYNNFTWDMEHNFTDNATFAVFSITFINGIYETMCTWQMNESNPLIFSFSVKILSAYAASSSYNNVNWAGYEFYGPTSTSYINAIQAEISMSNTYVPPVGQVNGLVEVALAAWVGLSPCAGGWAVNGTRYLAQTGYIISYWPEFPVGAASLVYEVLPNKLQYYPGGPTIVGGNIVTFEVQNLGSSDFEFTAYNTKTTYTYNYKTNAQQTYYGQYVTEAPGPGNSEIFGNVTQIIEFKPAVTMTVPELSIGNTWQTLYGPYTSGDYNNYILNQTPSKNVNINNAFLYNSTSCQYYMSYTWVNSDYNYAFANNIKSR